jgi:hypothetical protein
VSDFRVRFSCPIFVSDFRVRFSRVRWLAAARAGFDQDFGEESGGS